MTVVSMKYVGEVKMTEKVIGASVRSSGERSHLKTEKMNEWKLHTTRGRLKILEEIKYLELQTQSNLI